MVRVLCLLNRITPTSIPVELCSHLETRTDTDVVVVSFYDDGPGEYEDDVPDLPFPVVHLSATSRFNASAWWAFFTELWSGEYDLLHVHHNFSGAVGRVFARLAGVPVVDTEHRDHRSLSALQNAVNTLTLPLAARVVSNSGATQSSFRWHERLLLPERNRRVIRNGIDLDRIDRVLADIPEREASGPPRVITVGRLQPVKDQATLLRAFADVRQTHPEAELVVVGDGPLLSDLGSLAAALGIDDTIRFTGELPRDEVYRELAAADVFVMASKFEGFCVAAVEAMACGLPVVVSDIEVFHEVVGSCGRYAAVGDSVGFADRIDTLLTDPSERDAIGEAARRRARDRFSIEEAVSAYEGLYASLVES